MPDHVNGEHKSTKFLNLRKIALMLLVLIIIITVMVISQRTDKRGDSENRSVNNDSMRVDDTGIGLPQLLLNLQEDRNKRQPQQIVIFKSEDVKPVPEIPIPPLKPIQVYMRPPQEKLKVPDQELVNVGMQVRNAKIQAIQAPSRVGGFIEDGRQQVQSQEASTNRIAAQSTQGQTTQQSGIQGASGVQGDPNNQQGKRDFLYSQAGGLTPQGYSQNIPIPQQFPLELKAGTLIPGIMISGLNSDLPGAIMGQVSEHVYDTATGANILIPKGSRLIGVYDSNVTFGQKRVLVVWNRIIAPDGTSLNISGSQGMDRAGYAGMSGRVDEHWGRIIGTALLASTFIAGAEVIRGGDSTANNNNNSNSNNSKRPSEILSEAAANTVIEVGARMMEKVSNIQPTIKIRPGTRFNIFVAQDIIFPESWSSK